MTIEAFEDHHPRIHERAFVHASAVLIGRVEIGEESSVWPNVTLRGDDGTIVVGRCSSIQDNTVAHMTEGRSVTTVGDRVTVGHGVILHGCTIEDDCIVGMGAIILDNAVVERGCIVGAGALVPPGKRVPAGSVVVGNPFTVLRACTEADLEFIEYSWREYVKRTAQYRAAAGAP
ncbi:MAG: gamma carbonic anhydrase family protein [Myxococcales bacterium]|nr:gamma carbonic anhydrase family protein [Myxococcales bacterium]MCB9719051.1 gamma carbonic anhydrase family protein [Myxococcales bacterium]